MGIETKVKGCRSVCSAFSSKVKPNRVDGKITSLASLCSTNLLHPSMNGVETGLNGGAIVKIVSILYKMIVLKIGRISQLKRRTR